MTRSTKCKKELLVTIESELQFSLAKRARLFQGDGDKIADEHPETADKSRRERAWNVHREQIYIPHTGFDQDRVAEANSYKDLLRGPEGRTD
jgi:hypothetical protein